MVKYSGRAKHQWAKSVRPYQTDPKYFQIYLFPENEIEQQSAYSNDKLII